MSDHYETRCPSCGGSDEQGCYADCPTTVMSTLRAEVASKNEQFQQYARKMELDMNALTEENERLRAALKEVMEWSKPHDKVHIIARAALGEQHE